MLQLQFTSSLFKGCWHPDWGDYTYFDYDEFDDDFKIGDTVTYKCWHGFEYTGDPADLVSTCLPGGTWWPEPPICTRKCDKISYTYIYI